MKSRMLMNISLIFWKYLSCSVCIVAGADAE